MAEFEVVKAYRKAVSLLIGAAGPSGSGKTFSSLLLAAGIAGPKGKVGMIDAENARGLLYADDPEILAAMPRGETYDYVPITSPYTPARYILALKALERAGVTVAVVDSTSHEWEGEGGCEEIAENNKLGGAANWALAKGEHKKFVAYCLSSRMHIIFCLRAREKSKPVKKGMPIPGVYAPGAAIPTYEKSGYIDLGMQPIAEKNFVFEMILSFMFEDGTHHAHPIKVPKMLRSAFPGGRMITKADGEFLREWNDRGQDMTEDQAFKRARLAAEEGTDEYKMFFSGLSTSLRKTISGDPRHTENKKIAEAADKRRSTPEIPTFGHRDTPADLPEMFDGPECIWNGLHHVRTESGSYEPVKEKAA